MLNLKQILYDAWQVTQNNRQLSVFGFIIALFGILFGGFTSLYRGAYFYAAVFGEEALILDMIAEYRELVVDYVADNITLAIAAGLIGVIFYGLYFLLPTVCHGALISSIVRLRRGLKAVAIDGFLTGLKKFPYLFEWRVIIGTFSFGTFSYILYLIIRFFGLDYIPLFAIPLTILLIGSLFVSVFMAYGEYFIVADDISVILAIRRSAGMVLRNLRETILIAIFLGLIFVRVVINVILVFLIPGLIMAMTSYLVTTLSPQIAIALAALLGFVILVIASVYSGALIIFTTAVWSITYLALSQRAAEDEIPTVVDQAQVMSQNILAQGMNADEAEEIEPLVLSENTTSTPEIIEPEVIEPVPEPIEAETYETPDFTPPSYETPAEDQDTPPPPEGQLELGIDEPPGDNSY